MRIGNAAVQLRAAGPLDWGGEGSDLSIELRSHDERSLDLVRQSAVGDITIGGLNADLAVTGRLTAPRWRLKASAGSIASDAAVP